MTIEELFNARVDAAVDEVMAGVDRRDAEIEERKQVYVQHLLQIEMVRLIGKVA